MLEVVILYLIRLDKVGIFEWSWSSSLNPENSDHCRLANALEVATKIGERDPKLRCQSTTLQVIANSGLDVVEWEDLSQRDDPIAWYTPLQRALDDPNMDWPDSSELAPLFGGISKVAASLIVEAAKLKVCYLQIFVPTS